MKSIYPSQDSIPTTIYEGIHDLLTQHLPLLHATHILVATQQGFHRKKLMTLQQSLQDGMCLSQALMRCYPKIDPQELYWIRLGEQNRQLPQCLEHILTHRKHTESFKHEAYQACFYPLLTLILALIIGAILMTEVMPTLLELYPQQNIPLPALTQALLHFVHALGHWQNWLGFSSLSILFAWLYKTVLWPRHGMTIPGLHAWQTHLRYSQACHVLHLNLAQHIPLHKALKQAAISCHHHPTLQPMTTLAIHIIQGHPLTIALQLTPQIHPLMKAWLLLSQNHKQLARNLHKLSKLFDQRAKQDSQRLQRWLHPILLCLSSLVIGVIVIAIYLPLFQLGQTF